MLSSIITDTINLNSKDNDGNNILQQAILEDNDELVALILEKIENNSEKKKIINSQNNNGETGFFIAVKNENNIIAEMLDFAGADKSIRNNNGEYVINKEDDNQNEDINELIFSENEELVDFQFPIVKCNKKSDADLTDVLFKLSKLKESNIQPIELTDTEIITDNDHLIDMKFLNQLIDQYLILKQIKKQDGGNKKRKIFGSRKI